MDIVPLSIYKHKKPLSLLQLPMTDQAILSFTIISANLMLYLNQFENKDNSLIRAIAF